MQRVPLLALGDGRVVAQSSAILEYLEEAHPELPALLPPLSEPFARAQVRNLCGIICSDTQPLQSLGVQAKVRSPEYSQQPRGTGANLMVITGDGAPARERARSRQGRVDALLDRARAGRGGGGDRGHRGRLLPGRPRDARGRIPAAASGQRAARWPRHGCVPDHCQGRRGTRGAAGVRPLAARSAARRQVGPGRGRS